MSFEAASPPGEGFTHPGQSLWAAREGRLRLLSARGTVHELTWGKLLPDGGTLIDVMSPSISLDGKRILFAGRRSDGHGRFRIYQIDLDGNHLQPLTGGNDDQGCNELPPLRWRTDGSVLPDDERKRTDYDDVDPVELNLSERRIVFASSRTPDLGLDHARRSTVLWMLYPDGRKIPLTGNRNNDRWPFLLSSGYLGFSLWSRNREVIAQDRRDVIPIGFNQRTASNPTDTWQAAFTQIPGGHFGMLAKPNHPVWRIRPLFVNRLVFMTEIETEKSKFLTIAQTVPGYIGQAPSSLRLDAPPPKAESGIRFGPRTDALGNRFWAGTPSPCPEGKIVLAGAPMKSDEDRPSPGDFGLYLCNDDWPEGEEPADATEIQLKSLFNDPDLVDAEPVAVYPRSIETRQAEQPGSGSGTPPAELRLISGSVYRGEKGQLFATALDGPTMMAQLPGQKTDSGASPIFHAPPSGRIERIRIYASRRDRFDDPKIPRIPGGWEPILDLPVTNGTVASWIPTDSPTVLAGFDSTGRVAEWQSQVSDHAGNRASFYAFAGDHYSLAQPHGKHFCVGCHPGHSGLDPASHIHRERLK